MLEIQFASTLNLIQMKLMKVIHIMKNMMNEEFQHSGESRLIEAMNVKMHMIESVSIENLFK
jgi:hypothetical protein